MTSRHCIGYLGGRPGNAPDGFGKTERQGFSSAASRMVHVRTLTPPETGHAN